MEIEHFSHEHPLILKEEHLHHQHQHDDSHEKLIARCDGCLEAIIIGGGPGGIKLNGGPSSYMSCSQLGCDFYLHESCAKLPLQITQHPLHPHHPLTLLAKTPYLSYAICDDCGKPWNNFIYHCSICNFDLDVFCAFPATKIKTEEHIHHLIKLGRSALLLCDACGLEHKGYFYTCPTCI